MTSRRKHRSTLWKVGFMAGAGRRLIPLLGAILLMPNASGELPQPARPRRPEPPPTTIKVDVPLVLVNVTVTDPMNRLVAGLQKEHFAILEDKTPQTISHFGAEEAPISVGIIFDISGSMGHKLIKAREAVSEFLKTANPQDEFFLIQFNNRPRLTTDFSGRIAELQNSLTFSESKGATALLDAIYLGIHEMRKASNAKKALLIISDGGDNNSRYSAREIKRIVREADLQIYAIGIFESNWRRDQTIEERAGPRLLFDIAEPTGGRQFRPLNLGDLPDIAANIGVELRNQYVLGYAPTNQDTDGRWRRLRVRMNAIRGVPRLRAYYRVGYYAPGR